MTQPFPYYIRKTSTLTLHWLLLSAPVDSSYPWNTTFRSIILSPAQQICNCICLPALCLTVLSTRPKPVTMTQSPWQHPLGAVTHILYQTLFTPFLAHFPLVVVAMLPLVPAAISFEGSNTSKGQILSISMGLLHPAKLLPLSSEHLCPGFPPCYIYLPLDSSHPTPNTLLSSPK